MNDFSRFDANKILVFDGFCKFCSWGIQFLLKQDKQQVFLFSASQGNGGMKLLTHFKIQKVESVLYLRNGVVLTSSTAVLYVLRDLGYPWKILFVFIIVPSFIRDAFYGVFAKVRYLFFGRRVECRLPRENELNRFL